MPPKPQQTLPLTCVVRQAVAVDIQLVNPLDCPRDARVSEALPNICVLGSLQCAWHACQCPDMTTTMIYENSHRGNSQKRVRALMMQLCQDDVVVFEVTLNGDGLLGEAEFVLAPKETATYELVFSPLLPSRKKGLLGCAAQTRRTLTLLDAL
eukprot:783661-Amphidinium_carterae.3